MIDLIETQRIKEEMDAQPQNVAHIIENTTLGICITDEKGNFALVNNNYCQIYGYTREELIGHNFTVVVPEEKLHQLRALHDKFIRDKIEILRDWEVVTKSGKRIQISVDAGYSETILTKRPHKITFIQPEEE